MVTEKRFTIKHYESTDWIYDNGKVIHTSKVVDLLNTLYEENRELQRHLDVMRSGALTDDKRIKELYDENEQLKQREENLLSEIDDFQELLSKNDGVCHKRVIDLIDDRISNFSNVRAELLLHSDDDYRLEKLSFAIQNLRELKKELSE